MKVCIDAGHFGKYNRAPSVPEYYESDMAWKLSEKQRKYFNQLGIETVMTRTNQATDLALQSRGKASKGCDLFISNHSNATGSGVNESIDYPLVIHLTDDAGVTCDDVSKEIAQLLAPVIQKVMLTKQAAKTQSRLSDSDKNGDGVLNDNYYGVLNGARLVGTPGLILEHSFHTNTASAQWLLKDENLERLAKAEVECIASYLLGRVVSIAGASGNESAGNTASQPATPSNTQSVQPSVSGSSGGIKSLEEIAKLVIAGKYGNGEDRKKKLEAEGYNYSEVQKRVNEILKGNTPVTPTAGNSSNTGSNTSNSTSANVSGVDIDKIARDVINGKYGNGETRKQKLAAAGYDYATVQARVNQILKGK